MTKLDLLNRLFLQFFFIRLTRHVIKTKEFIKEDDAGIDHFEIITHQYYSIMYFVIPLTGYGCDFIYLGKRNFLKLTSSKEIKNSQ